MPEPIASFSPLLEDGNALAQRLDLVFRGREVVEEALIVIARLLGGLHVLSDEGLFALDVFELFACLRQLLFGSGPLLLQVTGVFEGFLDFVGEAAGLSVGEKLIAVLVDQLVWAGQCLLFCDQEFSGLPCADVRLEPVVRRGALLDA